MNKINNKSCGKTHFFYITLILISIIIVLASVYWTEIDRFTEYLSTAATFSSLLLALVAINYSFISNTSLNSTLDRVSKAANQTKKASKEINDISEKMNLLVEQTNNDIKELKEGVTKLDSKQDIYFNNQSSNEIKGIAINSDLKQIFDNAIKYASPAGWLFLYACYLSKKCRRPFLLDIVKEYASEDYFHGYLISLVSIGAIEYKILDHLTPLIIITNCPDNFLDGKKYFLQSSDKVYLDRIETLLMCDEIKNL